LRGLRRGEAAGLRWCDVDLDEGVAVITQQLQQYDGHMVTCPPKTSHSARVIALDHTTVAALRAHRARQHQPGHHDSGYVFTGLGGDPLAPDRLTRHFRVLTKTAGLPPIRLHDLRHGAATLALAAGVELKVVQDMMGHASIVLTADTYTSVLPEVARTAAEQVATLILNAGRLIPGTTRTRRPSSRRRKRQAHDAASARLTAAHPARQITRPRRPRHQPGLRPTRNARLLDGRQASTESPSTRKGHLNSGTACRAINVRQDAKPRPAGTGRGMGDRSSNGEPENWNSLDPERPQRGPSQDQRSWRNST
jgi:integrase-like protein